MDTLHSTHLLLVEDDVELATWIEEYLSARGFNVTTCHRGDEAVRLIKNLNPDCVLLDGMLPGMDLPTCQFWQGMLGQQPRTPSFWHFFWADRARIKDIGKLGDQQML